MQLLKLGARGHFFPDCSETDILHNLLHIIALGLATGKEILPLEHLTNVLEAVFIAH